MNTGVLLMAYGSPGSLDEVEPYLRDVRGGRPVMPGAVAALLERYRRAGCPTPLVEISRRQADALRRRLDVPVLVGMKHWTPRIREAVEQFAALGIEAVLGVALAPHYSRISIGGYEERALKAMADAGASFSFRMVRSWHTEPAFLKLSARNLTAALDGWDPAGTRVFFTAHSLPARILAEGDPYRDQLLASSGEIARAAGAGDWELAFQSASDTGEPWLGPDVLERLEAFAAEGGARAVVAPVGFVADHLEILYDVDIEAADVAAQLGLVFRRTESPNDDPLLTEALAAAVRRAGEAP